MALKVDRKRTYTRTVKDPDDGTKYNVELRKMTEGDSQKRSDLATRARLAERRRKKGRKARKQGSDASFMEYSFGKIRQFDLETSLVSWEFPFPLTTKDIAELDPDVADQIHDHIEELNPFIFRDDFDEEVEEDEDENDEEELEEGADSPPLHAVEGEVEQEFAEDEGPTKSAVSS